MSASSWQPRPHDHLVEPFFAGIETGGGEVGSSPSPDVRASTPDEQRARAERRAEDTEAGFFLVMIRIMAAMGLLGALGLLVQSFREPEEVSRALALTLVVTCGSLFVPWARLPLLARRVHAPAPFLSVFTKLALALSLPTIPLLLVRGPLPLAGLAVYVAIASLGIWLRWEWVAWMWYPLFVAALGFGLFEAWSDVSGAEVGVRAVLDLVSRLPAVAILLLLPYEVVRWHRALRASASATSSARGPAGA
jgi:hypothetical protein